MIEYLIFTKIRNDWTKIVDFLCTTTTNIQGGRKMQIYAATIFSPHSFKNWTLGIKTKI